MSMRVRSTRRVSATRLRVLETITQPKRPMAPSRMAAPRRMRPKEGDARRSKVAGFCTNGRAADNRLRSDFAARPGRSRRHPLTPFSFGDDSLRETAKTEARTPSLPVRRTIDSSRNGRANASSGASSAARPIRTGGPGGRARGGGRPDEAVGRGADPAEGVAGEQRETPVRGRGEGRDFLRRDDAARLEPVARDRAVESADQDDVARANPGEAAEEGITMAGDDAVPGGVAAGRRRSRQVPGSLAQRGVVDPLEDHEVDPHARDLDT